MSISKTLLDWGATAASAAGVFGSMCLFDPIQRLALLVSPRAHQRAVSGMAWGINRGAMLAGVRYRVEGLGNIDWDQNYIIVSNHQSLLDISMTSEFLARLEPRYVSKIELQQGLPGVSYNLSRGGSVCIDRKDPVQAIAAIEEMAKRVRDRGYSVVIYPEGTRSKTGAMRSFREGGLHAMLLNAPGVPVLPLTTSGGSRVFGNDLQPIVRGVELGFHVHPPVMPPDVRDATAFTAFVRELERTIASALPESDRAGLSVEGTAAASRAKRRAAASPRAERAEEAVAPN